MSKISFYPFDYYWWKYVFEKPCYGSSWLRSIWCRINKHPRGPVYYNPTGFEPDMTCKDCGDEL